MAENQRIGKIVSSPLRFIVFGILLMIAFGTVYSWSVFRVYVEKVYDIGSTQSGLPYMVSLASLSILMVITGRTLDRRDPRQLILIGSLLVSFGWIASSFASNILWLTLTYGVVIGSGVGIAYAVPMRIVARYFPKQKGLAVGLVLMGFGMSPVITAPLARQMIESFGLSRAFLILGVSYLFLLPMLAIPMRYPKETIVSNSSQSSPRRSFHAIVKDRKFLGIYLNFLIGSLIGLTLIGLSKNIGVDYVKMSSTHVAFAISMFAVFNGLGRPLFGWLSDKLGIRKSMLISYAFILFSSLLMIFLYQYETVFLIAMSIFWLNLGGWLAIAPAATAQFFPPEEYSRTFGYIFSAYGIGAILGVSSSGILLDLLNSYSALFILIGLLSLLGMVATLKLIQKS